jgi:hypothetical protein
MNRNSIRTYSCASPRVHVRTILKQATSSISMTLCVHPIDTLPSRHECARDEEEDNISIASRPSIRGSLTNHFCPHTSRVSMMPHGPSFCDRTGTRCVDTEDAAFSSLAASRCKANKCYQRRDMMWCQSLISGASLRPPSSRSS